MSVEYIVETKDLKKVFKSKDRTVNAVNGVNLKIKTGQIYGFLGPNGAGKTTTLRMLATLLPIDEGEATINGVNVKNNAKQVRKHIGYVSQSGGSDDNAIGLDDMILQGRLYGMSRTKSIQRAKELIKLLSLGDFINRKVVTYSGGQRRRLDIAIGIMHAPALLFLDEPTTGLDPQNRANLWGQIRKLRDNGTTIFLTTHYLEEADELSDYISIMDNGKIVAEGTPRELKKRIAGDSIIIKPKIDTNTSLKNINDLLNKQDYVKESKIEDSNMHLYVEDGAKSLPKIFDFLESKKITVESVSLSEPSLDDVFLKETGRSLRDNQKEGK
jgi:ABC-2 type transport system ATP-binding protein